MKIIKQSLFKIDLARPDTQWSNVIFVEADTLEEALAIAREVVIKHYKDWNITAIGSHAPLFKSLTKTITVEV